MESSAPASRLPTEGERASRLDRRLLAAAALALGAAIAGPTVRVEQPLFEHLVVLDVTQSMQVADYRLDGRPVSRLAYAKRALSRALATLPCGSKVGWGLFTEYRSFLLLAPVEVCANLAELREVLDRIDAGMAWAGGSEVAKGIHSGIAAARRLAGPPSLVFVTDGHEAPPLDPRRRPAFAGTPGEVKGLVVGTGDDAPSAIPKIDPLGRPIGVWRADEVPQTDPRSRGRGGSVRDEATVDALDAPDTLAAPPLPGGTPGSEHLSSLREAYLRIVAAESGLGYHRLRDADGLARALSDPALARPAIAPLELRGALAALALALLVVRHAIALAGRRRR